MNDIKVRYRKDKVLIQILFGLPICSLGLYSTADLMTYVIGIPPLIGGWKPHGEWAAQIGIIPLLPVASILTYRNIKAFFTQSISITATLDKITLHFFGNLTVEASAIQKFIIQSNTNKKKDRFRVTMNYIDPEKGERSKELESHFFQDGTINNLLKIRDHMNANFDIDITPVKDRLSPDLLARVQEAMGK